MTNKDDIVIPRSELPKTLITINSTGTYIHPKDSASMWSVTKEASGTVRRRAMDYLAVAEAIDGYLADAAKAKEEEKLDEESLVLYNALHDRKSDRWDAGDSYLKRYWRNVARAARELHGK